MAEQAQPTAAPTQPTAAPTQPTAAPTQPTAAPTQPSGASGEVSLGDLSNYVANSVKEETMDPSQGMAKYMKLRRAEVEDPNRESPRTVKLYESMMSHIDSRINGSKGPSPQKGATSPDSPKSMIDSSEVIQVPGSLHKEPKSNLYTQQSGQSEPSISGMSDDDIISQVLGGDGGESPTPQDTTPFQPQESQVTPEPAGQVDPHTAEMIRLLREQNQQLLALVQQGHTASPAHQEPPEPTDPRLPSIQTNDPDSLAVGMARQSLGEYASDSEIQAHAKDLDLLFALRYYENNQEVEDPAKLKRDIQTMMGRIQSRVDEISNRASYQSEIAQLKKFQEETLRRSQMDAGFKNTSNELQEILANPAAQVQQQFPTLLKWSQRPQARDQVIQTAIRGASQFSSPGEDSWGAAIGKCLKDAENLMTVHIPQLARAKASGHLDMVIQGITPVVEGTAYEPLFQSLVDIIRGEPQAPPQAPANGVSVPPALQKGRTETPSRVFNLNASKKEMSEMDPQDLNELRRQYMATRMAQRKVNQK